MSKKTLGLALASAMILASAAWADQFYFSSPGNTTWNGVYVNPYQGVDNTQPQNNPLTIYCDDWNTDFSGNPTWNADVYTLTANNLSHLKYGATTPNYNLTLDSVHNTLSATLSPTPTPFNRYLEAAWLNDQWQSNPSQSTTVQIEIAAAQWSLFVDPSHVGGPLDNPTSGLIGAINNSGYATAVYNYLHAAQTAVAGGYTAPGWDVIVPVGNAFPMQEFLVKDFSGRTSVPEPSAVILLGTVAGFLGVTAWRRKRRV